VCVFVGGLQVPVGVHKTELLADLDRLPIFCQQISQTIRAQTVGKAATFSKASTFTINSNNLKHCDIFCTFRTTSDCLILLLIRYLIWTVKHTSPLSYRNSNLVLPTTFTGVFMLFQRFPV